MKKNEFALYKILLIPVFLILLVGIQNSYSLASEESTTGKQDLLYILEPLTSQQLEKCKEIFVDYTRLYEDEFNQRYLYHTFIGNCVMLYDDPVWEFRGDDNFETMANERLQELIEQREQKRVKNVMYIDTKSIVELAVEGTYLFTFEGCTGEQSVRVGDVLIASDTEVIPAVQSADADRIIEPGTCRQVERQISAQDPESIRVLIPSLGIGTLEEVEKITKVKSPRAQMAQGTQAHLVECAEGLVLMSKNSDGSAACVKSSSVSKLVARGWGTEF